VPGERAGAREPGTGGTTREGRDKQEGWPYARPAAFCVSFCFVCASVLRPCLPLQRSRTGEAARHSVLRADTELILSAEAECC
jgi:hypothetical protein